MREIIKKYMEKFCITETEVQASQKNSRMHA
nr:MAG TPA: hypothetical protein [Caudoviricetes sp.]